MLSNLFSPKHYVNIFSHFFNAIQLQIKKPHKPIYRFYQSLFLQNNFFKIVNRVFFSPITALTAHSKMPLVWITSDLDISKNPFAPIESANCFPSVEETTFIHLLMDLSFRRSVCVAVKTMGTLLRMFFRISGIQKDVILSKDCLSITL